MTLQRTASESFRLGKNLPEEYRDDEPEPLGAALRRVCRRLQAERVWLREPGPEQREEPLQEDIDFDDRSGPR